MTVELYLAPAGAGKTTYAVRELREAARDMASSPLAVVASSLQVRALRARLAAAGGAIGVRVMTFDQLFAGCISGAGQAVTELSEPVQYRLLRAVVDGAQLAHYRRIADRPGLIQALQATIAEVKAWGLDPQAFAENVRALGNPPRLAEIAAVYATYDVRLQENGWTDRSGLGGLAAESLGRARSGAVDWPLVMLDGFDRFSPTQVRFLQALASRAGRLVITLTGELGRSRPEAHRRSQRTRKSLEEALGIQATALPDMGGLRAPALAHLEATLFTSGSGSALAAGAVDLIAAPDRADEARAALRWLKQRIVTDGFGLGEVALLARDIAPYRAFIAQAADEFRLPLWTVDGQALRANPCVAALLALLETARPDPLSGEPALPRRQVIDAWRSPYFKWDGAEQGDASDLDELARKGRVIAGRDQWVEAFDLARDANTDKPDTSDGSDMAPADPTQHLHERFDRFVALLTPPEQTMAYRGFVRWVENLLGNEDDDENGDDVGGLHVVACVRSGPEACLARDIAALRTFKDVLRGLVWAEDALGGEPVPFGRFLDELRGATDAASYQPSLRPGTDAITVADVPSARGLSFRAVAVLGLAEGDFPAVLHEDPFLRDADRRVMGLEPSTESSEAGYFYEAVTRARTRLLLTRPLLADNGTPWQASPFWEEVLARLGVVPQTLRSDQMAGALASWPEALEAIAVQGDGPLRRWAVQEAPDRVRMVDLGTLVQRARRRNTDGNRFDGDLTSAMAGLYKRFGPDHQWSASGVETYRACPFQFFMAYVMNARPREEPVEGLDASQLGHVYHALFEQLFAPTVDITDVAVLEARLAETAPIVLDDAPRREGFRVTAWWRQTCDEMVDNVRRAIPSLAGDPNGFRPVAVEVRFGGSRSLVVGVDGESFRLQGVIDRIDRNPAGQVRVIDYKTSGKANFGRKALEKGRKLQLALYAAAAEKALRAGRAVDGFYWHILTAEPSDLTLRDQEGGAQGAIAMAEGFALEAVRGVRGGQFPPVPPDEGCPAYCAAAAFCARYRPGFGA